MVTFNNATFQFMYFLQMCVFACKGVQRLYRGFIEGEVREVWCMTHTGSGPYGWVSPLLCVSVCLLCLIHTLFHVSPEVENGPPSF